MKSKINICFTNKMLKLLKEHILSKLLRRIKPIAFIIYSKFLWYYANAIAV